MTAEWPQGYLDPAERTLQPGGRAGLWGSPCRLCMHEYVLCLAKCVLCVCRRGSVDREERRPESK